MNSTQRHTGTKSGVGLQSGKVNELSDVDATAASPKLPRWSHLPFLLGITTAAMGYGYYSCDHLVTGFDLMIYGPYAIALWIVLFAGSCILLAYRSPKGKRRYAILLHLPIAVFVTVVSWMFLPPAGEWIWEQIVLSPRREAMVEFARGKGTSPQSPIEVAGYRFEMAERTSQGAMFYTVMAGGPFVSSGIYVSLSAEYRGFRPPQEGEPREARSVVPTSVRDLFRFVTRD